MKRLIIVVVFVLFGSVAGFSQGFSRVTSGVDVGLGYLDKKWAPSITYHQELSLTNFSWFRIGWGVRGWGYYAGRSEFVPRNSALSDDTLKFGRVTSNGISFLLGANIRVWRFDIGANTDVVGVAFGVKRRGLYTSPSPFEGSGSANYNGYVPSSPNPINALPFFLGQQAGQSELYLRFWISEEVGVKLGYVHGNIAYRADEKLNNGQRRFGGTYGLPYAAISFKLYN